MESPGGAQGIERPDFGALLPSSTLVVASIADEHPVDAVPGAGSLVTQSGGDWRTFEGAQLDPRAEGQVELGPGTLYGAIKRMVTRGWISEVERPPEAEDERRRYYSITAEGRQAAAREARRMAELIDIARAKALRIT